ncbi:MAG: T9SS type A sorting domain-containing protein, partial [Bacteroidetes bacterium]
TINNSTSSSTSVTACDSYTWNAVTYTASGTYTTTGLTNAAGCDSSATVILTINSSSSSSTSVTACDSYTWNAVTYTTSGTYTTTGLTNAAGCDSSATVILTINNSTSSSTSVTACDSYTWNAVTYTTSGTYTTTGLTNAAGCDSSATVILTINSSSSSSTSVTACDSYTWNAVTYTTSGTYTTTGLTNAAGCDSSATVILTINSSSSSSTSVTACDSYTWNAVTYTASGTYTTTGLTNAAGCDSSATVILTINNSSSSSQSQSACGSYLWAVNNVTYTSSGTYTFTGVNGSGCPHVYTLILSISNLNVTATPGGAIACFGGTVTVNVTASGGVGPYSGIGSYMQGDGTMVYTVTDANLCSGTASVTLSAPAKVEGSTSTTPANCSAPVGTATVSASGGNGTYTYMWSNGQTFASATGLMAGNYTVTITDGNGCTGTASATVVGVGVIPDPAGTLTGPAGACRNTCGIVYTVPPVSGATSYTWTLPSGATGTSTSNSITLCFDNTYNGGFLCVTPVNSCGSGTSSCINIPVITVKPAQPGFIVGNPNPCGNTVHTYTLPPSANALSYTWTVTGAGVTILSGQGSNTVQVSFPTGFGQAVISVFASNCVGTTSTRSTTLTGIPTHSSALFGPGFVCANTSGVAYSISSVIGAGTSYVWSTTGDMSIAAPPGSNSTVVNFGPTFISGLLSVTTSSACGTFTRSYTLRSVPAQPGSISGPGTNLCGLTGVTYTIIPVLGATSYNWTVPSGVNITNNTGLSITVDFTPTFTGTGNICVASVNSCGSSITRCYSVTAAPAGPDNITGPSIVCKSASSVAYSVSMVPGAIGYLWSITGGPTLTSSSNTANVNYTTATATSATLTVNATNACGASTPTRITVAVNLGCRTADGSISKDNLSAYPNPTSGLLTVKFEASQSAKYSLKVTDILGNVMLNNIIDAAEGSNMQELNLSHVAKGIYFLSIESSDEKAQTLRIVVE